MTLAETRNASLAGSAVTALMDELEAYPKPGLVSPRDSGAHTDMDMELMRRSANSLFDPFAAIAAAGREGRSFQADLIPLGIAAEQEMLRVTGGVNTHRGAVFTLGLLVAALARTESLARPATSENLRRTLIETWGPDLRAHASAEEITPSHGALVRRKTGAGGARREAALGFPQIFEIGLPAFRAAIASGIDWNAARIHTFFVLMESAEDTNVLFRGGPEAAHFVRESARDFLAAGGCTTTGWFARAEEIHSAFVRRNLSPGGCADLLSGTLLVADRRI